MKTLSVLENVKTLLDQGVTDAASERRSVTLSVAEKDLRPT
jgi:hypothetical protein